MKKIIPVLFILLFISTMSAHAEAVYPFNGYGWENYSEKEKILIMYGLVVGYKVGWRDGYTKGFNHDVKWKIDKKTDTKEGIITIPEVEKVLNESVGFYSHELEFFFKNISIMPKKKRYQI